MTKFYCFSSLLPGKKKNNKGSPKAAHVYNGNGSEALQVKTNRLRVIPLNVVVPIAIGTPGRDTADNAKVMSNDNSVGTDRVAEAAYEGGDGHDEIFSMRMDFPGSDLRVEASKAEVCLIEPEAISNSPDTELRRSNQQAGYTSDTLEPAHIPTTRNNEAKDKRPQNQSVEFSTESSSLDRVRAWVNNLGDNLVGPLSEEDDYEQTTQHVISPSSPNTEESPGRNQPSVSRHPTEEVLQAKNTMKSPNPTSSVAHISGMALKAIPVISVFSSLRFVNLSKNSIVNIPLGVLPRSLHTLDLSRNMIVTIEGLKDLTQLRVLNLSYNRISRLGHGLSNCTLIKELYLTGNMISNAEGLHRLLKLSVLDLSHNKIATTRSLGQFAANYKSLLALNLLGNPIQRNVGDDQLRKAVIGLLPQLTYLNKQPIKPQRTREAFSSSIAKAALGNSRWNNQRRPGKQVSQLSGSSIKGRAEDREQSGGPGHRSSRHGSSNRQQQRSGRK